MISIIALLAVLTLLALGLSDNQQDLFAGYFTTMSAI
jgi:hypothetical protein